MQLKKRAKEFLKTALHTWATIGYDTKYGGYVEAISFSGEPLYHLDKRFRIHPRNIFSHSAGAFWGYAHCIETAESAFRFMIEKCWNHNHEGFVSLTSREGEHKDIHMRSYEHAFVLLGLGWLYYVTKKKQYKQWLDATWSIFERTFAHSDGGFYTSIPDDETPRQQNPHMHVFEALLNLYELFKEDRWLQAAKRLYLLFRTYMCTQEENILREFFYDDWTPHKEKGMFVDPGHHYEWVVLLHKYEKLSGEKVDCISHLYDFALRGTSTVTNLGYDECYYNGDVYRNTHRLWVQTEQLKAHLIMSQRTDDASQKNAYLMEAHALLAILFDYYFIEEKGLWYDTVDEGYNNISENAPASTLYHVVIALHEYISIVI